MLQRVRARQIKSRFAPELPQLAPIVPSDSWYGSNVRPQQYQQPRAQLNYLRPSVFWTPITPLEQGITWGAFQGSSVRPLQFQHGTEGWRNALHPNLFWTPILDQNRGITAAAWQGSNVRPNPILWRRNYLHLFHWLEAEPIVYTPLVIAGIRITYSFHNVGLTFAVSCNYQAEPGVVDTFTSDSALLNAYTPDTPLVLTWVSDPPYCKPGQT